MNTIMNIDPWGFLDDLLGVPSRTFQAMRARAAGRFPPRKYARWATRLIR